MESLPAIFAALDSNGCLVLACYIGLHVAFAALFLPCSPFTFFAGSIRGIWPGLAISSGAALLASGVTFAIGRSALAGIGARFIARSSFIKQVREYVVFSMIFATVFLGFWMLVRRSLRRPVEIIGQSSEVDNNNAN